MAATSTPDDTQRRLACNCIEIAVPTSRGDTHIVTPYPGCPLHTSTTR